MESYATSFGHQQSLANLRSPNNHIPFASPPSVLWQRKGKPVKQQSNAYTARVTVQG